MKIRLYSAGLLLSFSFATAAQDASDSLFVIEFDKRGRYSERALANLRERLRDEAPTDIFVLAHGWNNSRGDAVASYEKIIELIGNAKDESSGERPFWVGVAWPSKAWDSSRQQAKKELSAAEAEDLMQDFRDAADREPSDEDVAMLGEMLEQGSVENVLPILERYSTGTSAVEERSIFDGGVDPSDLASRGVKGGWSVRDLLRVFTFWQMKRRAGVVGAKGGEPLLRLLATHRPGTRVHAIGHSFGCKFWLSALAAADDREIVDSLLLVQGAVSSYAFADAVPKFDEPGGYASVPERVQGTTLVTFSEEDWALRLYEAGSWFGSKPGEIQLSKGDPRLYTALGAVGAARAGARTDLKASGHRYELRDDLVSVNLGQGIGGHSDFHSKEVGWLFRSVIEAVP